MTGHSFDGTIIEPVISAAQKALIPEVSGNDINGLNEQTRRPPSPLYWGNPETLAHGKMQAWMIAKCNTDVPEINDLRNQLGGRGSAEPGPKAAAPRQGSPEIFAAEAKSFARHHEADMVAVTRLDPNWVYADETLDHPWLIVLGLIMDHGELAAAPKPPSVIEVMRQYNRGTRVARALAGWVRAQGYEAVPHGGPIRGPLTMVPAAIAGGLGELGKHGSLITRAVGASLRLASVSTDMPLVADQPDTFGVDDFCLNCKLCTEACPPDAIFAAKQMVRGAIKWFVDFDKCVPYFNETYGCGICIAVCPWSRPGVAPKLAKKMSARRGY